MVSAFEPAMQNGREPGRVEHEPKSFGRSSSPPGLRRSSFDSEGEPHDDHVDEESRYHEEENNDMDESSASDNDTEDEEVKIHCIGGVSAVRDSDMSDDDDSEGKVSGDSDMDSDADGESDGERVDEGVVNFVSNKIDKTPSSPIIQRPTPTVLKASRQPMAFSPMPADRDSEAMSSDSDDSTSSSSSVGARGIGLSLESDKPNLSNEEDASGDSSEESSDSEGDQVSEADNDDEDSSADDDSRSSRDDEDEVDAESDMEGDTSEIEHIEHSSGQNDDRSGEAYADEGHFHQHYLGVEEPIHHTAERWAGNEMSINSDLKPSPSLEEIEDIIDEDNTMGALDSNADDKDARLAGELSDILSDLLEFDYWSKETLKTVVDTLASANSTDSGLSSSNADEGYPVHLPERDDATFWIDKLGDRSFPNARLKQFLELHPCQRIQASRRICDAFHAEMMSLDLTHIKLSGIEAMLNSGNKTPQETKQREPNLFVGSFSSAESRLVLAFLDIKRVIQVSYHQLDELWVSDGIDYTSYLLQSVGDGNASSAVYEAVREGADEISAVVKQWTDPCAVLVTCSTGDEHACAVCALFIAKHYGMSTADATSLVAKSRPTCRIDPEWLKAGEPSQKVILHKTKRVLSSNMLSSMNSEQGMGFGSPKRIRCTDESSPPSRAPLLPALNLGPAALFDPDQSGKEPLKMRGSEGYMSSSTEEEEEREQDMRLSEELQEAKDDQEKPSTPVPLLTPPASPVQVQSEEGPTTVCEWPSNLTVDSAMTSAIDLRPLSPNSLQKQEEEEERRTHVQASTLTPMIRGISVNLD